MTDMTDTEPFGPVLLVGCGLIGTSIGMCLSQQGIEVHLQDADADNLAAAARMGAGDPGSPRDQPRLVVVAVPPHETGLCLAHAVNSWPHAAVTDVASVKTGPLRHVLSTDVDVRRYVGSHPMAGNEGSGPSAASAELFSGRPWAIARHEMSCPSAVTSVEGLARRCGSRVVHVSAAEHDAAVATTSHVPYLLSVLAAARLAQGDDVELSLVGPGLLGLTRTALSDPILWAQILTANADQVKPRLEEVSAGLRAVLDALGDPDGASGLVAQLSKGLAGAAAIRTASE